HEAEKPEFPREREGSVEQIGGRAVGEVEHLRRRVHGGEDRIRVDAKVAERDGVAAGRVAGHVGWRGPLSTRSGSEKQDGSEHDERSVHGGTWLSSRMEKPSALRRTGGWTIC